VASKESPVAFLLWGKHAQAKTRLIEDLGQVAVPSPHPMARLHDGFLGSQPFSKANAGLERGHADPIIWSLDD
jgi:uracil-DNA glycosylase